MAVYDQYYRHFKEQLASPDLVVYLKATPQVLRERIVRKNVASEAQISDEYLAEVAEGIKQLAKGEELALPTEVERSRCARCGRMLPEKDGICPACMKKLDTLRIISDTLW